MTNSKLPYETNKRLNALLEYSILDTLPEEDFDNITAIAAEICHTPISLITLLDDKRQWFKSRHGLDITETPIEYSFCSHAIKNPKQECVVNDTTKDARFKDNPFVVGDPHVCFYAGIPLVNPKGVAMGTLCVIDVQPKKLSENQITALKALANQVVTFLELRKNEAAIEKQKHELEILYKKELEEKDARIKNFSFTTSHELRHEFAKIMSFIELSNWEETTFDELKFYFKQVETAATKMDVIISKLNDDLNMVSGKSQFFNAIGLEEVEEILLVDDDPVVHFINKKHIKQVMPEKKVISFTYPDDCIKYLLKDPMKKRFAFVDIEFRHTETGWDFLEAVKTNSIPLPVAILSSTVDHKDFEKAMEYENVAKFIAKPLSVKNVETMK